MASSGEQHVEEQPTSHGDEQQPSHGDGQSTLHVGEQQPSHGGGQSTSHEDGQSTSHGDGQSTSHGGGQSTSHGGEQLSQGDERNKSHEGEQPSQGDERQPSQERKQKTPQGEQLEKDTHSDHGNGHPGSGSAGGEGSGIALPVDGGALGGGTGTPGDGDARQSNGMSNRPKRQSKLNEKGMQLALETKTRLLKGAINKFKGAIAETETLLADCENTFELRQNRDKIAALFCSVMDLFNDVSSKIPEAEEIGFSKRVETLEDRKLDLFRRLTEKIQEIEREVKARSVTGSHRSSSSKSSRRSSTSRRSSQKSGKSNNTMKSGSSLSEMKAEAAAEAAALQAQSKFIEAEARHQVELQRIQHAKNLEAANARVKALEKFAPDADVPQRQDTDVSQHTDTDIPKHSFNLKAPEFVPKPKTLVTTEQAAGPSESPRVVPEDSIDASIDESQHQPAAGVNSLARAVSGQMQVSRYPVPEPGVFMGDPVQYPSWKVAFKILIDDKDIPECEKVYYLKKYLGGEAHEAVEGYLLLPTEQSFRSAKELLEERYGDPFCIANAFRDKLDHWPRIAAKDGIGLRKLADFLRQCRLTMETVPSLSILDDDRENKKLLLKLPDWVTTRWSRIVASHKEETGRFPPFSVFVEFLAKEAKVACDPVSSLQALNKDREAARPRNPRSDVKPARTLSTFTQMQASSTPQQIQVKPVHNQGQDAGGQAKRIKPCFLCAGTSHALDECPQFLEQPLDERKKYIATNSLCFGCLRKGHKSRECRSRIKCKTCDKQHPSSLHGDIKPSIPEATNSTEVKHANVGFVALDGGSASKSTMIVPVVVSHEDRPDHGITVYAMLDTQSDTTFISESASMSLGLLGTPVKLRLSTMSATDELIDSSKVAGLRIHGIRNDIDISLPTTYTRDVMPVDRSHIPRPETVSQWPHLQNIASQLPPMLDCEVGLLIGYDCPRALVPREVVPHPDAGPYAQRTDLGWGVVGVLTPAEFEGDAIGVSHKVIANPTGLETGSDAVCHTQIVLRTRVKEIKVCDPHNSTLPRDLNRLLMQEFCERNQETSGSTLQVASQEDFLFLRKMEESIHMNNGHYEMPLPLRNGDVQLPNNRQLALKRLYHLGRKLKRNPVLQDDYKTFMANMIAKGHAEAIPDGDQAVRGRVWYIPHQGVYHPKKPNKLRVVFDCSAKLNGQSLNDNLLQGPDMTNNLIGVLLRFRLEPVAFTCDVEAMFHQFLVNTEDRDLLRFLWWKDGNLAEEPSEYRMAVHLFGAASSPACASFGLKQIAEDNIEQFGSEAADFLRNDFYVDDGLKSMPDVESAVKLVRSSQGMCKNGGLHLHKFASNNKDVLRAIPPSDCAQDLTNLDLTMDKLPAERALGVHWCVENDTLGFRIVLQDQPLSRRGILSTVSSIYDPLGFAAPFVLTGKRILQSMCKDGLDWDEPLPDSFRPLWESWRSQIVHLKDLEIPRCTKPTNFGETVSIELHHFADASQTGYGCCSYLRQMNAQGDVHCSLVMGKSRVTPLKPITVPRLELTAAVTAAKVSQLLQRELRNHQIKHYYWTDSTVVLGYISNQTSRYHIYVANRIQQIRDISDSNQWNHVPTSENPADIASRGCTTEELVTSSCWFMGPDFLWEKELPPKQEIAPISEHDPEVKGHAFNTKSREENPILRQLQRFTSWNRMQRVVALCLSLKKHVVRGSSRAQLTVAELQSSADVIIKLVQKEHFGEEIRDLNSELETVKCTSPLYKLDPFVDENGLLRVGGRLRSSSLPFHVKHPVLLPKKHHVSDAILRHFHQHTVHQGRGMTICSLREHGFWILGASKAAASLIAHCVSCRKLRGKSLVQKMDDLPRERLEPAPPFTYAGMDLFGPFYVKEGRKEMKRWGCIFTCLSSRAIHLEVTTSLSTDTFINALRRFISLRGSVRELKCDRGTNFVGASRELKLALTEIDDERVRQHLIDHSCDFVFNPPDASHMGGVWERQIRTIRNVLSSLLSQWGTILDDDSLRTFMAEAAAIVNSRPLTVDTLNDPTALTPITPNHLLTGKSSVILPPPGDFQRPDLYARKRWRRVQHLANSFWTRWRREYVQSLQRRSKWSRPQRNLAKGDIVLISDDNLPRNQWRMGRVNEATPSRDGKVRKAKVTVGDPLLSRSGRRMQAASVLERPIHKLVLLLEAAEEVQTDRGNEE